PGVGVVREGCIDAALGCYGMGTDRVDLGDKPDVVPLTEPYRGPQARETSTNDHNIVFEHC
ncbi:MAG: hypothetical protein H6Q55_3554, partial [Deltaproteobacteria bacterium]|nr:hypothetical protein [Deltaproteobacteria bacterium]